MGFLNTRSLKSTATSIMSTAPDISDAASETTQSSVAESQQSVFQRVVSKGAKPPSGLLAKPQTAPNRGRPWGRPAEDALRINTINKAGRALTKAAATNDPAEAQRYCAQLIKLCDDHGIKLNEAVHIQSETGGPLPLQVLVNRHRAAARLLLEKLPYGTYADDAIRCSKGGPLPEGATKHRYLGLTDGTWGVQQVKRTKGFRTEVYEGSFSCEPKKRPIRAGAGELTLAHSAQFPGEERTLSARFVDDLATGRGKQRVVLRDAQDQINECYTYIGNFEQGDYKGAGRIRLANKHTVTSCRFDGLTFDSGHYNFSSDARQHSSAACALEDGILTLRLERVSLQLTNGDIYKGEGRVDWTRPCAVDEDTFVRDGHGVLERQSGETFEGTFEAGNFTRGLQSFPNGITRRGDFANWQIEGLGVETHANGDRLEGRFTAGLMQGPFLITESEFPQDPLVQHFVDSQPTGDRLDVATSWRQLVLGVNAASNQ